MEVRTPTNQRQIELEPSHGSIRDIPHSSSELLAYECDACSIGGRFFNLHAIERHMRRSTKDANFYQCPGCDCLACTPKQMLKHLESNYAPESCQAQHGLTEDKILSDCSVAKVPDPKAPKYYRERCFDAETPAWLEAKRKEARRNHGRVILDPGQTYPPDPRDNGGTRSNGRILCDLRRYTLKKVAKEMHQDEWREEFSSLERGMQKVPKEQWLDISLDPAGYSQHRRGYRRGSSRACCTGNIVKAGVIKSWPSLNLKEKHRA